MNLKDFFSIENIVELGEWIATVICSLYIICRTIKTKMETYNKEGNKIPSLIKHQVDKDKNIQLEMEKIKEIIGADRVQVYDFHNGGHYANGRSALKIDCTYEVCRYGINAQYLTLQDIPISCIPNFVNTLLTDGVLYVSNIEDIKEQMPATYQMKKNMNITSFYDVVITNENNEPIGFVAIQGCNNNVLRIDEDAIKKFVWFMEQKISEISKNIKS